MMKKHSAAGRESGYIGVKKILVRIIGTPVGWQTQEGGGGEDGAGRGGERDSGDNGSK